ncbi:glucokinase [Actimicrobium sp. CCI2.3]|uniref:glucokinase n=1 Tax=Actimicrobium sp. CCI2.3 TaxID=3048616 RepID=UPI002AB49E16|nr:glucokinase [Actimicrobium sp. CCI2.3]MDY7573193.1 glucokinase [Actimicrobium sp. CCI2.3]MEB0022172.1 glucokinase [Actimicrobium sp. CCI2.3]
MSSTVPANSRDAQSALYLDGPRLLADIGGTNARFALERAPGQIEAIRVLRCADHAEFVIAVESYLVEVGQPVVRHAAIAIANPVQGDEIKMTNHHWAFSIDSTRRRLNFDTLLIVNDFTALAMSLPHLEPTHLAQVGPGESRPGGVIGLVGAGTGLGVGGLIPTAGRWIALGSEGGHVTFSPADEREIAVLQYCWKTWPHVSAERLVSGPGIELIYQALAARSGIAADQLATPEIIQRALAGSDPLCIDVVDCFCGMLGTVASNVAVTLGTLGGIYIGGGVVPHLGEYFARSSFRRRFEDKGRFGDYLGNIPTFVITAPYPAFVGVAAILSEHLGGGNAIPILERIRKSRSSFSPAEQKVASLILAHPRAVMNEPISEIARRAEVSQPTVIRFCRSLGCQGLADFKLKLASGVTGTVPVAHSQVHVGDSSLDLGVKVVDNTITAMLEVRDNLNAESLSAVIEALSQASRIEFYGFGSCGLVAEDAQQKFFRLGIPTSASTDPQVQEVSAAMLGPRDVAVIISNSGKLRHLAAAVEAAMASGATVIALAPANSQLARRAHLTLAVEHDEGSAAHIPMVSRILLLVLIDMLAVGVSLNRTSPFAELQRQAKRGILNHIASSTNHELDRLNEDGGPIGPVISHTV